MSSEFLNNVKNGKNQFWRYFINIILTFVVGNVVGGIILGILLSIYLISTGQLSPEILANMNSYIMGNIVPFLIMTLITFSFTGLLFIIGFKYLHKRKLMSLINISDKIEDLSNVSWIERIKWNNFLKGFITWIIFCTVLLILSYLISPQSYHFNPSIEGIYLIILLLIICLPIQVSFEELFFRGYLNQGISLIIKRPLIVIIISSAIFSLGHITNGGLEPIMVATNILVTFVVGIILSIYTLQDEGIERAIGIHLGNNLFAFLIISSEGSVGTFSTLISAKMDPILDLIITLIAYILFLVGIILYKREKTLKILKPNI